jgi:uncharacterized protein (TIGR02453 family)
VGFEGWPKSALEFFEGLEADNTKSYWTEHKGTYEAGVKAPMLALLAELEDEFGAGRLYRPYRDIRFSADKTPYKTAIAASVGPQGYISLSADGLMAGSGIYHMSNDQLASYRAAIDDERTGSELEEIVARLRNFGSEVEGVEPLKTAPRGYPKDHPRVDLLRNKGLVTMKSWEPKGWLATRAAKDRIAAFLQTAAPLRGWLSEHVGSERAGAEEG